MRAHSVVPAHWASRTGRSAYLEVLVGARVVRVGRMEAPTEMSVASRRRYTPLCCWRAWRASDASRFLRAARGPESSNLVIDTHACEMGCCFAFGNSKWATTRSLLATPVRATPVARAKRALLVLKISRSAAGRRGEPHPLTRLAMPTSCRRRNTQKEQRPLCSGGDRFRFRTILDGVYRRSPPSVKFGELSGSGCAPLRHTLVYRLEGNSVRCASGGNKRERVCRHEELEHMRTRNNVPRFAQV